MELDLASKSHWITEGDVSCDYELLFRSKLGKRYLLFVPSRPFEDYGCVRTWCSSAVAEALTQNSFVPYTGYIKYLLTFTIKRSGTRSRPGRDLVPGHGRCAWSMV